MENLEHAYVLLVDRQIRPRLEGETVEMLSEEEHAIFEHLIEFEIGFQLSSVEIVTALAQLVGIIKPIP